MKYWKNTKINPQEKVFSSCLEDYKPMLHAFLISNTFVYINRLRSDLKY